MGIRWWESDAALNGAGSAKLQAENAMLIERVARLESAIAGPASVRA
jgi:hypothetical protein